MQLDGSVHLSRHGITWKRSGGGKTVEVPKSDITGMMWLETPRVGTQHGLKFLCAGGDASERG